MSIQVSVSFRGSVLRCCLGSLLWLTILGRSVEGQAARGTLEGIVRDERGAPITGVEISVEGQNRRVASGEDGRFSMADVALGRHTVRARRLGYSPDAREVEVGKSSGVLELRLRRLPQVMPTVTVRERADPSEARLAGFRARAATASASAGHIFTRARIEQSANRSVLDLIRTLPGVRIQAGNARTGGPTLSLRFRTNRCPPAVFIDGYASSVGEFDIESINLNMVEGVEVYPTSSSVPPEFFATSRGQEQCGVIAIWSSPTASRRPRATPRDSVDGETSRRRALCPVVVDQVAVLASIISDIAIPDSLRSRSVAAETTLEFVVDDRGRVVPATVRVLSTPDSLIGAMFRDAVLGSLWIPAEVKGRRVSQLVTQPFRLQAEASRDSRDSARIGSRADSLGTCRARATDNRTP